MTSRPIASALELIRKVQSPESEGGYGAPRVICGVSGGKDSMAVLDLLCRVYDPDDVRPFYLYFLRDLECEETFVGFCERRFNIKITRLRHPDAIAYVKSGRFRLRRPSLDESVIPFSWNEAEAIMRGRMHTKWVGYGHRIVDSLQRRGMLLAGQGILAKYHRLYPIWDWSPGDVITYLHLRSIPVPGMFGEAIHNTSGICPHSATWLKWMREHYPADFEKMVRTFPFCLSVIARDEQREKLDILQPESEDEKRKEKKRGKKEGTKRRGPRNGNRSSAAGEEAAS